MARIDCTSYFIYINESWDHFSHLVEVKNPSKIIVLADENTQMHCLPKLMPYIPIPAEVICIPPGEIFKNLDTCKAIWDRFIHLGLDRKALCINLGGGVIGDMGGFVSATYMRGIDFIQMPTTLLSMVDASIGGKVAVDYRDYKNLIGAFSDPKMVWIQTGFLKTLPEREVRSGFAETIKHALIADIKLWEALNTVDAPLEAAKNDGIIMQSINVKKSIVDTDPFESGPRKGLNFGHSIGHAVEKAFLRSDVPLLHGEAIAIGMICAAYLSRHKNLLSEIELNAIRRFIAGIYTKTPLSPDHIDAIIDAIKMDKKNIDGEKRFVLLKGIGSFTYDVTINDDLIRESLNDYNGQ